MRLLSATVRAYRLHRETHVDFDPSRTLLGGPNEVGKSTFAEAIHRALFLKARGNTTAHRSMKSTVHLGTPEVELAFESGGITWHLKKRFGPTGDTTLTPSSGTSLTGEAAESRLAFVLGIEPGAAGKQASGQWSHLWVWQGQSADDPTPHATSQREGLLQRLQTIGGAAAMQSEGDSRTAAAVAAARDEIFTATGKLKTHSALAQAEAAVLAAAEAEGSARARASAQAAHAQTFTQAEADLAGSTKELADISAQQEQAARQQALILEHRRTEAAQAHAEAAARERSNALEAREIQGRQLRDQQISLAAELAPLDALTGSLTAADTAARQAAEVATRTWETASDAAARARQRHDLAQAQLQEHDTAARLEALTQRAAVAAGHLTETEKHRLALAGLPPIDGLDLASLQKLDAALHNATTTLTAMAAGVELLAADGAVLLDGDPLTPGAARILTEESELDLGDGRWRLRIRPGGGTSLAEAREALRLSRQRFLAGLEKYGIGSMEEAGAVHARRADIRERLLTGEAALNSLQAAGLPAALTEARAAHAAASADTARRLAALAKSSAGGMGGDLFEASDAVPSLAPTPSAEAARAALTNAVRLLEKAESASTKAKTQRDSAVRAASAAAAALARHQGSLHERQTRHTGLLGKLEFFLEQHGDDTTRGLAAQSARQEHAAALAALEQTRQALQDLQPDQNERTLQRLHRSLEDVRRRQSEAETRRAVAAAALTNDGSDDPAATLAMATARLVRERVAADRLRRSAEALRLLHDLFTAEQHALADRFTGPLADCISGYLECIFGPGARAAVVLEDNAFTGLQLQRPGHPAGALTFDSLSGGTREQTAAAVRLAMAEVLAPDYNGCLPVIFDDAFAHSDSARLQQLQNMLDLAASRGLQIILLTCAPADYAALGAATVDLSAAQDAKRE
jgi:AAA domain